MKDFGGKLAVITGGGTGMGRELARQLLAEGCDVAICDVIDENMQQTLAICEGEAPQGVRITAHHCDVASESDVERFRDEVLREHDRDHVNLLFNNAGVGGLYSFVDESARDGWERTFNICWYGVYYCSRAFVPLLVKADEAHLVNTSSVNGFWASLGPMSSHSAYSAAKFAVKGFSEALINDFRTNAPHVNVSVVMPGHIGTDISINSPSILGQKKPEELTAAELEPMRERIAALDPTAANLSDDEIRDLVKRRGEDFRNNAPTTAAQAATIILDGVKQERWRILVGKDAGVLDRLVREDPENAYTEAFMDRLRNEADWGIG